MVLYLGHRVGGGHLKPEPTKVEAIVNWPVPCTKKQVLAFLGTACYYSKFVPQYSALAKPLTDLTKKRLSVLVAWSPKCGEAFKALKAALASTPILAASDYRKRYLGR
ncbi:uncharacterized protein LOC142465423 [Ascaphus truei]|uniref:uncharacterized protein LOC142465423 n=1 Tax=Ascaphus truei TaxID=8439 RepID=UPI003F5A215D